MPTAICSFCGHETLLVAGGNRYCVNYYCDANENKEEVTPLEEFTYYD